MGLGLSSAGACDFQQSVEADQAKLDNTVVANVAVPQSTPVSHVDDRKSAELAKSELAD